MASGMSPRVVLVVSESDICSVYNRCSEGKRVLRRNGSRTIAGAFILLDTWSLLAGANF